MNAEISTNSALVEYYKFNQGTANSTNTGTTTLTDASGNSNNGTTEYLANRLKLPAAFNMFLPGPRMVWQFGELIFGYTNTSDCWSPFNACCFSGRSFFSPVRAWTSDRLQS